MKKIIDLATPPITTYPSIAYILALKWKDKETIMPWLSDHFIQIVVRPEHAFTWGDFYEHADLDNFFSKIFGLPGLGWMRANKTVAHFDTFTDYVEYLIDNDYCIEACLDRYYFSFTNSYQKEHFIHSTLIYGYDKNNKIVYLADFFDHGKYIVKEASYDEVNKSINNDYMINLYKSEEGSYRFDKELMRRYFEDYLNSEDSFSKFVFSNKQYNKSARFGLAYYDYLIERILQKEYLDKRMYHLLCDHKVLMKYRLEYLREVALFDADRLNALLEKNEDLISMTKNLRNLVIKQTIAYNEAADDRIVSKIGELKQYDADFVKDVLALYDK